MSDYPAPQPKQIDIYPTAIPSIQRDPLGTLRELYDTHGDVLDVPLGPWHATLLNHPDAVRQVLQVNNRNYSKRTVQYDALSMVTGRGLLTSDGEQWLRQRRLIQPMFHRERLARLGGLITGATERMLQRWGEVAAAGEMLDVDEEIMTVTLEIVGQALFGLDLSDESSELHHAVLETLEYILYRAQKIISIPLAVPTSRNRRFRRALETVDTFVYETISRRREQGGQAEGDLLDLLLEAQDADSGARMSDRQVRDEVVTLIIAGYETVASAMIWTFYLLARHPQVRQQLQREVDHVLQGHLPTVESLRGLSYTRAVFEETLRLYPPAWLITRRALETDEVAGIEVPAGSLVIMSPYTVHRHPGFWPDAERFEPARFLDEERPGGHRFAYIPFGGGPRLCIGDSFALLEAQLMIASIVSRCELQLMPGYEAVPQAMVTLRPRGGLPMRPSCR